MVRFVDFLSAPMVDGWSQLLKHSFFMKFCVVHLSVCQMILTVFELDLHSLGKTKVLKILPALCIRWYPS